MQDAQVTTNAGMQLVQARDNCLRLSSKLSSCECLGSSLLTARKAKQENRVPRAYKQKPPVTNA
eukprot:855527-Pelagomonas_calceolata.AAC.2